MVRVSLPVWCSMKRATLLAIPPSRSTVPTPRRSSSSTVPSLGRAPSATTTMLNRRPAASRLRIFSQTFSMSNGISGIRITSAPPERPLYSAIQPEYRPISFYHNHAIVALRRGMQPVERLGRGAHRGVEPEAPLGPADVVVDRLRHADDRHALAPELMRDLEAAVAADGNQRVEPAGLERGDEVIGAVGLELARPSSSFVT